MQYLFISFVCVVSEATRSMHSPKFPMGDLPNLGMLLHTRALKKKILY